MTNIDITVLAQIGSYSLYWELRKREKEENDKAENTGHTIKYDPKMRVLLRDNIVIDRFKPTFYN